MPKQLHHTLNLLKRSQHLNVSAFCLAAITEKLELLEKNNEKHLRGNIFFGTFYWFFSVSTPVVPLVRCNALSVMHVPRRAVRGDNHGNSNKYETNPSVPQPGDGGLSSCFAAAAAMNARILQISLSASRPLVSLQLTFCS